MNPYTPKPVTFESVWHDLDNLCHTLREAKEACGVKTGSSKVEAPPRDPMQLSYYVVRANHELEKITTACRALVQPYAVKFDPAQESAGDVAWAGPEQTAGKVIR